MTKRSGRLHISIVAFAAAVTLAALAGCSATPEVADEPGATQLSINLGATQGGPASLLPRIADKEGMFESRNLTVDFAVQGSGPELLAAALAGDVDVFGTAAGLTNAAAAQGECIQYLTMDIGSIYSVVGRADLDWPNAGKGYPDAIRDLKGKTIGVTARGAATELMLRSLLTGAGVNPDSDVTFVAVGGPATIVTAIQEKTVDASFALPPVQQILGDDGYVDIYDPKSDPSKPLGDALVQGTAATCGFVKANEPAAQAFCSAMSEAADFVRDPANSKVTIETLAEIQGASFEDAEKSWTALSIAFGTAPKMTEAIWDAQAAYTSAEFKHVSYKDGVYAACQSS